MSATLFKWQKFRRTSLVKFTAHNAIVANSPVEVQATGRVVQQAAAGSTKIVGHAMETVADTDNVLVDIRGTIIVAKAKGAITAGDPIGAASDASGAYSTITVAAFGDVLKVVGIALDTISDGATGQVLLF